MKGVAKTDKTAIIKKMIEDYEDGWVNGGGDEEAIQYAKEFRWDKFLKGRNLVKWNRWMSLIDRRGEIGDEEYEREMMVMEELIESVSGMSYEDAKEKYWDGL